MKKSIAAEKSYSLALRIIKLYKYLVEEKKEFVLSKQLLRCGTSTGANVEEALGAQSKKEFASKMSIAYKEARETEYWLRLLHDSSYINDAEFQSIVADSHEVLKIVGSIVKTSFGR